MKERNALKELEEWRNGHKARYVTRLCIGDGYAADCWELVIGNMSVKPGNDWHKGSDWAKEHNRAELYAYETNFVGYDELPPNILFVVDGDEMEDWPGVETLILTALDKAKELGL